MILSNISENPFWNFRLQERCGHGISFISLIRVIMVIGEYLVEHANARVVASSMERLEPKAYNIQLAQVSQLDCPSIKDESEDRPWKSTEKTVETLMT